MIRRPPRSTLFPYTRSSDLPGAALLGLALSHGGHLTHGSPVNFSGTLFHASSYGVRSEEHTSELQSQSNLVCRLLLEKKKKYNIRTLTTTNPAHAHQQSTTP